MTELERLLGEIRNDARWREEVEAIRRQRSTLPDTSDVAAGVLGTPAPPVEEDDEVELYEAPPLLVPVAPRLDEGLPAGLAALAQAIEAADNVIEVASGRSPLAGPWAELRRRIHAEIRISQDRQTAVNRALIELVGRLARALDPADPDSAVSGLWSELGRLSARISVLEQAVARVEIDRRRDQRLGAARLAAVQAAAEGRATDLATRIGVLDDANAAVNLELEPLARLRLAVTDLAARLSAAEARAGSAGEVVEVVPPSRSARGRSTRSAGLASDNPAG